MYQQNHSVSLPIKQFGCDLLPEFIIWAIFALFESSNNSSPLLVLMPRHAAFKQHWNSSWHFLSNLLNICLFFPTGNFTVKCAFLNQSLLVSSPSLPTAPSTSLFSKSLGSSLWTILLVWLLIAMGDILLCIAWFDQWQLVFSFAQ